MQSSEYFNRGQKTTPTSDVAYNCGSGLLTAITYAVIEVLLVLICVYLCASVVKKELKIAAQYAENIDALRG